MTRELPRLATVAALFRLTEPSLPFSRLPNAVAMKRMLQSRLLSQAEVTASFFNPQFGKHGRVCRHLGNRHHNCWDNTSRRREILLNGGAQLLDKLQRKNYVDLMLQSTFYDLSAKKCVPCDSKDIRPMAEESANELIPKVPGWKLVNEGGTLKLQRSWKTKTFIKGLEFFQAVADVAEAEGHHPDLHLVGWNNVKIEIWTHSVGGLTENDFILASKINQLDLEHLLRRKAAAQ